MTRRDLRWRIAGATLLVAGCAIARLDPGVSGSGTAQALLGFVMALGGLILAIQGRRVAMALRIERSRHRDLPRAVHDRHTHRRLP